MNSYIFYGSEKAFKKIIPPEYKTLTELVSETDVNHMILHIEGQSHEEDIIKKVHVTNLVIDAQEYASVKEHVILNFTNFLAKMDILNIYLQNPPIQISEQIKRMNPDTKFESQKYKTVTEETIQLINEHYDDTIIGQTDVKRNIMKAFLPLTFSNRKKPVVMLFYGSSGVGKTETANYISSCLNENLFRKQFSMYQNNQFSTYLFGGTHSEKSFAKDLLNRESNVILLDEFDKAYTIFHSAFYQLFDEGIFVDQNYTVQLHKSVIICTSNYKDLNEIKKELGDAIFNRFDAVIGFAELTIDAKRIISERIIKKRQAQYQNEKKMQLPDMFISKLYDLAVKCNNVREIQHLINDTFALYYINERCK